MEVIRSMARFGLLILNKGNGNQCGFDENYCKQLLLHKHKS
jgi:hypothetical protein